VFKDPDTEEEKLCVVVTLDGGVSDVEFSLVGIVPGSNIVKFPMPGPHSVRYTSHLQERNRLKGNIVLARPNCFPQKRFEIPL
jgi:hypothetical protein